MKILNMQKISLKDITRAVATASGIGIGTTIAVQNGQREIVVPQAQEKQVPQMINIYTSDSAGRVTRRSVDYVLDDIQFDDGGSVKVENGDWTKTIELLEEQQKEIQTLFTRINNQINIWTEDKISKDKRVSKLETEVDDLKDSINELWTNQKILSGQILGLAGRVEELEKCKKPDKDMDSIDNEDISVGSGDVIDNDDGKGDLIDNEEKEPSSLDNTQEDKQDGDTIDNEDQDGDSIDNEDVSLESEDGDDVDNKEEGDVIDNVDQINSQQFGAPIIEVPVFDPEELEEPKLPHSILFSYKAGEEESPEVFEEVVLSRDLIEDNGDDQEEEEIKEFVGGWSPQTHGSGKPTKGLSGETLDNEGGQEIPLTVLGWGIPKNGLEGEISDISGSSPQLRGLEGSSKDLETSFSEAPAPSADESKHEDEKTPSAIESLKEIGRSIRDTISNIGSTFGNAYDNVRELLKEKAQSDVIDEDPAYTT